MEIEQLLDGGKMKKSDAPHPLGNSGDYTLYPESEEEIVNILKYANENSKTVSIIGRGTKRGYGGTASSYDILLSMERFTGIIEHVPGDMTVTVKPGTTMKDLQAFLAEHNQMVSLDPEWPENTSIGGVVASNSSGPKRLKYGSARDHVIGMRIVYADGRVLKKGGKVVKNVAGYDMNKLFIGSMGTLGVISEITLKLRPLPKEENLVLMSFSHDTWNTLRPFVVDFLDSILEPVSLELLNSSLSEELTEANDYTLAIAFEDVEKAVEYQVNWLQENCPENIRLQILQKEEAVKFWSSFAELSPNSLQPLEDPEKVEASLKIGTKNMDVFDLITETDQIKQENDSVIIRAHGGLGHGITKVYLEGPEEQIIQAVQRLRQLAEKKGGYAVVTHLPVAVRNKVDVWGPSPSYFFLLDGIKKQADPNRILNPGRFVGGI